MVIENSRHSVADTSGADTTPEGRSRPFADKPVMVRIIACRKVFI